MPQEFQVLQCYSCNVFQVEIVKKKPKWDCKICHEKQSVKQVFLRGTSKDCRVLVQDCNEKRLALDDTHKFNNAIITPSHGNTVEKCTSKWSEFIPNDPRFAEGRQATTSDYTFERPAKRRKVSRESDECMEAEFNECGSSNDHAISLLQHTIDEDRHSIFNPSGQLTDSYVVSTFVEHQPQLREVDKCQENYYNEYQSQRKEPAAYQSNINSCFENGTKQHDSSRGGCSAMSHLVFEDDDSVEFSDDDFLF